MIIQAGGEWALALWHLVDEVRLELLLFAGFWLVVGALDELVIDAIWAWLRLTRRATTPRVAMAPGRELSGRIVLFVPAWREARVIGAMLRHTLDAWPQRDLLVYAGCYQNDPDTQAAILSVRDSRLRMVVNERDGPTTKGDCLNRLWRAMCDEERASGVRVRAVLLHDAEDMVHPLALQLIDSALDEADFVQIPVRPEPQPRSVWIAGHYTDEFTDSHARLMVVRNWLGVGIPAAGVGCAFSRDALERVARQRGANARNIQPFAPDSLTEDYELGLRIGSEGKGGRFLRARATDGSLIATRCYFPDRLYAAVRQKTRWLRGIAFDGWDRLGWSTDPLECWMRMRDRRGPLTAFVLAAAYLLIVAQALLWIGGASGLYTGRPLPPLAVTLLALTTAAFIWRTLLRAALTAREYGWHEGGAAVLRIPIANVIAIMASLRAMFSYVCSLFGRRQRWDKTEHDIHPAEVLGDGLTPGQAS